MTLKRSQTSFFLFFLLFLINCQSEKPAPQLQNNREKQIETTARDFFKTFADRQDWDRLCSFYREDLEFEDISLQLKLDSLWQFKRFYKWDEEGGNFKKLTPDQEHLTLYSLVANDSIAVARGRVNPFYYYGEMIDVEWGMEFTIWLYFDENLKIKKQVDWMEYGPTVFEAVINRVRENGIDKIPDWLDLSRE
ncbi:MAG: hypothetical protein AAFZ15_16965 [Bacteroidota bacterium]